jgi:two-component system sensor histidine kinase/response regulator
MPLHSPSDITSNKNSAVGSNRDPHKPTLLVIDDEEGPRQSVKIIFKDEYNVLLAKDGESALELARNNPVDVAVCDIMMGGMPGTEVLRRLKDLDPTIEVIMLTAYETIDTARHSVRYGASDYLNKPFDIPTLRAAVARAREKRQSAKKLQGNNQVLDQLQREIHDQQLKEEMSRTKGEIYASVLHDINGPLTIISGFIEMINRSIENAATLEGEQLTTIKDDLSKLTGQVERCFEISRRYLSFLRDKSSGASQVGINQILSDVRELLIRHPSARGQQLIVHTLPSDVIAEINGTDLLQILLNLTINALQASNQPHRVEVRPQIMEFPLNVEQFHDSHEERFINREGFANRPPILAISVQDNGPGISPEFMPKMFETKFTTKAADQGTGLGLSIVRRLVKEADGAIHLHSKVGHGSTITVCLRTQQA